MAHGALLAYLRVLIGPRTLFDESHGCRTLRVEADAKGQSRYRNLRSPPRLLVPCPARILDDHGDVAEISTVAHRRLYSDLRDDPADREGTHPKVAWGYVEEGPLEGAHGDLVGDRFARQWGELGHDLGLRSLGREGDTASSTLSTCCQAIACLSCETPISCLGSDAWRLKNTQKPPREPRTAPLRPWR
jgi:hypothetical protein